MRPELLLDAGRGQRPVADEDLACHDRMPGGDRPAAQPRLDLVCWPQEGVQYAGALVDPVEAWLRCGPVSARHTVVAGQVLVRDGALTAPGVEEKLLLHAVAAARIQGVSQ